MCATELRSGCKSGSARVEVMETRTPTRTPLGHGCNPSRASQEVQRNSLGLHGPRIRAKSGSRIRRSQPRYAEQPLGVAERPRAAGEDELEPWAAMHGDLTSCPTRLNVGIMSRMYLTENTGLNCLRCSECARPMDR